MFHSMPLFFVLGLRYVRAKRRNRFISFMSLSSMLGIMLGVMTLITVMSIMNGFEKELRERILSMTPHIKLTGEGDTLTQWQALKKAMDTAPSLLGSSPFIQKQGLIAGASEVKGVMVRGVDVDLDPSVSPIPDLLVAGDWQDLKQPWSMIIGEEIAQSLALSVGDHLKLIAPEAKVSAMGFVPRIKEFKIVGIFKAGMYDYDSGLVLTNLADAQVLFRMGDLVSGLQLAVKDMLNLTPVRHEIAQRIENVVFIRDWRQEHANFFKAIAMEKRMMFIVLTLIIMVAVFNIVSSMVMLVTEKQSDIAILRTMGITRGEIRLSFITLGVVIGLMGSLFGVLSGVLISANIDVIVPFIENLLDVHFFPPEVYYISKVPSVLDWSEAAWVAGIAFVLTVLATLYPSHRASQVQPAEALRYE